MQRRLQTPNNAPRWPQERPRRPQDGRQRRQDGSKLAPRRPQDGPKTAPSRPRRPQDGPKTAPSRLQVASKSHSKGTLTSRRSNMRPRPLWDPPGEPQEAPKRPPRAPKGPPRGSQEAHKRPPIAPKQPPRDLQEPHGSPRLLQTCNNMRPDGHIRLSIPLLPQRPINYVRGWPAMRRRRCQ